MLGVMRCTPADSTDRSPAPAALPAGARRDLAALYERVDREVEASGVACWLRGACCDFERNDHVLYATSLEIAWVRERHCAQDHPFAADSALCPFWQGGVCVERERRPLGCRTFFCDERFRVRLEALHESYHRELGALAERWEEPYRYEPFVRALRALPDDRRAPTTDDMSSNDGR